MERIQQHSRSPSGHHVPQEVNRLLRFSGGPAMQFVRGFRALRQRVNEKQVVDALGLPSSDERHGSAHGEPSNERRATNSDRVHDRDHVVSHLFEGWHIGHLVRKAKTPPLKEDVPRVSRNVLEVVVDIRICPHQVKVLRDLQEVNDIYRTSPNHLVRQRRAIAVDVMRGGRVHVWQRIRGEQYVRKIDAAVGAIVASERAAWSQAKRRSNGSRRNVVLS
jgi:hypothetical protein